MGFSSRIKNYEHRLSKLLLKKDISLASSFYVASFVVVIVSILFFSNAFNGIETYLQALIYQFGYKVPDNTGKLVVVKKDQTTSALINKEPGRIEYASLFNLLGSSQKVDRLYKSRSMQYELLKIDFGIFKDIRNQLPITTSYDEWRGLVDKSSTAEDRNVENFDQDNWLGMSRQIIELFKTGENREKPGFTSLMKVSGKTWLPRGSSIFKVLAGGNNYLVLPTLCVPWHSEAVKKEVESIIGNEDVERQNDELEKKAKDKYKGNKQSIRDLLERWTNLFENLRYAEIIYDVKFFPKKKRSEENYNTFVSIALKLKTYAHDTAYEVNPTSVIGFDFVLQGDKNVEEDALLVSALENVGSKVVLAAHKRTEILYDEGASDEKAFTQALNMNKGNAGASVNNGNNSSEIELNTSDRKVEISDDVLIKPADRFLKNKKNVDYAMIDMISGSKAYISEAPIIIITNEEVYNENGVLIATQSIRPSFALRLALEKLDFDANRAFENKLAAIKKNLFNLRKDSEDYPIISKKYEDEITSINKKREELGYVETQKKVFEEIRESFCNGTFPGELTIKDLKIPVNKLGRLYINFTGSTRKGGGEKAAIDSVSFFECFEEKLLKEHLNKNKENTKLSPAFAHRRVLGRNKNKGGIVFVAGPFESTDFDFYPTPVSFETPFQVVSEPLMGVEIHANIILNILNRNFLRHPNLSATLIGTLLVSFILGFILELTSPFIGMLIAFGFLFGTFAYSYYSYHILGQVFYFSSILTAISLVWVFSTLVSYIKQRTKAKTTKAMFSKFVSADVVQYMLDNPDLVRPGGTKTELTIFFSDVAGFTTISESLSPEDLVILLNEYLGAMTDLLFEYGGTLDKFIGDAVMAFWNFPKKQEDHAVRAVLCAIAMQKKIKELQEDWARRGFPKVVARCGINTAQVVVGYMGSQKAQMNFTCMGDGVNLASRLEGANKTYDSLMMISDGTYRQVKHAVRGRFLDFLAVKGKKEPVKVYELVCRHGEEPEGWFEKSEIYDRAIQLHLERKWDEAIETFESLLKKWPDDGPSKTYISRCEEYKASPPPENWDGRYILTHK